MSDTSEIRKAIKEILKKNNIDNKFSLKTVSFEGFGYGSKIFAEIKDIRSIELDKRIKIIDEIEELGKEMNFILYTN